MPLLWDTMWVNAMLVTCQKGYDIREKGMLGVRGDIITFIGQEHDLPKDWQACTKRIIECNHKVITPGLIDCHTHLIYSGNRAQEFSLRLQGYSYADICQQGGGIMHTVHATRAATQEALLAESLKRVQNLMASGVTALEIKSGYGLDQASELKLLKVAAALEQILPITIKKTFLGAHTFPPEYKSNPDAYVHLLCHDLIPVIAAEKLADCVDVFCEHIAFNLRQTEKIFTAAKASGLAIKCHAEQLSHFGATALAAKYQALSVDHLEYADEKDIMALKASGTVAILLPGAYYYLQEKQKPPIALLRQYDVPFAIASDLNPGTSPIESLLIIMNMACLLLALTPEEALLGVTKYAAKALGLGQTHGTLSVGKIADFVIWDVKHPAELIYPLGQQKLRQMIIKGQPI